jgi:predicted amidophosphoribosyltransferase
MNHPTAGTTKALLLFVPNHTRPRNREEEQAHLRAYLLKANNCPPEIVDTCAKQMASLIRGEKCILIPVPDRNGNTDRNWFLADRIAHFADEAEVQDSLTRSQPTASQCERHKKGKQALTPEELKITVKPHKLFKLLPVYFVDNVITTGATIQACHNALGFGTGLVYAEALRRA